MAGSITRREQDIMKLAKDIKDIKFTKQPLGDEQFEVSELIVMASAAGWYVGRVYKDPEMDNMICPWERLTHYTSKDGARTMLCTNQF